MYVTIARYNASATDPMCVRENGVDFFKRPNLPSIKTENIWHVESQHEAAQLRVWCMCECPPAQTICTVTTYVRNPPRKFGNAASGYSNGEFTVPGTALEKKPQAQSQPHRSHSADDSMGWLSVLFSCATFDSGCNLPILSVMIKTYPATSAKTTQRPIICTPNLKHISMLSDEQRRVRFLADENIARE